MIEKIDDDLKSFENKVYPECRTMEDVLIDKINEIIGFINKDKI